MTKALSGMGSIQILQTSTKSELQSSLRGPLSPHVILVDATQEDPSLKKVSPDVENVITETRGTAVRIIAMTRGPDSALRLGNLGVHDTVTVDAPHALWHARMRIQLRHLLVTGRLTTLATDRGLFAAGVLHDIRGAEGRIHWICERGIRDVQMARTSPSEETQLIPRLRAHAESLRSELTRLGSYASDVIRTVREGTGEPDLKSHAWTDIIKWTAPLVPDLEIRLTSHAPPQMSADGALLRLILLNVAQNSKKWGSPRLDITCSRVMAGGAELPRPVIQSRLRDFGSGVDPTNLKKIFEPFRKGSGSGGFGLGLALVASSAARMRGRVWAELPEDGPGLVICLELAEAHCI